MANYSSLTATQKEQVAFLFVDEIFGTDPNNYEYEFTGETVTGRASIHNANAVHARKAHTVTVNVAMREMPGELITVEMSNQLDVPASIEDFARRYIGRLIQNQSMNVEVPS